MSTRCQVIIRDKYNDKVWFYRHSDGYPDGVRDTLALLAYWVKQGLVRDNVEQASGWLVIIGKKEYDVPDTPENNNWKVGAYEPCISREHGDIDYLYTLDLEKIKVTYKKIYREEDSGRVYLLLDDSYLIDVNVESSDIYSKFYPGQ